MAVRDEIEAHIEQTTVPAVVNSLRGEWESEATVDQVADLMACVEVLYEAVLMLADRLDAVAH